MSAMRSDPLIALTKETCAPGHEALGWIKVTQKGRGGNSEFRKASKYALGWLPMADGTLTDNRWRRIQTIEEAVEVLRGVNPHRKRRPETV